MRKYNACIKQEKGLDTIGCGKIVINFEANSMEEAETKLYNIIDVNYLNNVYRLYTIKLSEVVSK